MLLTINFSDRNMTLCAFKCFVMCFEWIRLRVQLVDLFANGDVKVDESTLSMFMNVSTFMTSVRNRPMNKNGLGGTRTPGPSRSQAVVFSDLKDNCLARRVLCC